MSNLLGLHVLDNFDIYNKGGIMRGVGSRKEKLGQFT